LRVSFPTLAWLLAAIVLPPRCAGAAPASHEAPLAEGVALWRTADPEGAVLRLRQALERAPRGREHAKCALALARALTDAGQPSEAVAALDRVVRQTMPDVLVEAAAWERARALDASGNAAATRALADFVARHPRSGHADAARLALARRALEAGDAGTARVQADAVLRGRPARGWFGPRPACFGRAPSRVARATRRCAGCSSNCRTPPPRCGPACANPTCRAPNWTAGRRRSSRPGTTSRRCASTPRAGRAASATRPAR
jgi:predicted negative regulator of RcsB-dependent stress response